MGQVSASERSPGKFLYSSISTIILLFWHSNSLGNTRMHAGIPGWLDSIFKLKCGPSALKAENLVARKGSPRLWEKLVLCIIYNCTKDWCSFMVPYGFPGINQLPWRHHAHQERSSPWQAVLCPEKKAQPEGDTTLVNRISSKEEMRHPGEQHLFLTLGSQVEWSSVWQAVTVQA